MQALFVRVESEALGLFESEIAYSVLYIMFLIVDDCRDVCVLERTVAQKHTPLPVPRAAGAAGRLPHVPLAVRLC